MARCFDLVGCVGCEPAASYFVMGNAATTTMPAGVNATVMAPLRETFNSGKTRPLAYRQQQLAGIARLLKERESEMLQALREDLGKPAPEAFASETSAIARELAYARRRLPSWMRPERASTPLIAQPGRSRIYREPLGVVLLIGPWNYPLQLILVQLISAIAAGNCVVLKPSELAPASSALLARLLPKYLDREIIRVVEGGPAETTALLAEEFDHIFYTGGGTVARIIAEAAAKHLTPVTLELGGKSPCIVDRNTDLEVAARRIVWGKFMNAGQTCIAPDYVLVHEAVEQALISRMTKTIREFYGSDPRTSPDYGRMINRRHHKRVMGLLQGGGDILIGGEANEDELYIAPTILQHVPENAAVMEEEIFGPILPVIPVASIHDAVAFVNRRPKSLALYLFSADTRVRERVVAQTSSGAVVVNHVCIHEVLPTLPFGGVGASGMGAYHGKYGFETFSHRKPVVLKPTRMDLKLIYPPYDKNKEKWLRRLL
jgi:aldehyde dehydrogenase (NAD+)